jgi:hypothetical protein
MDQLWVVGISGGSVERGNLTQDREAFGDLGSPSGRAEQMPSGPKMCGDATQRAQLGSGTINESLIEVIEFGLPYPAAVGEHELI